MIRYLLITEPARGLSVRIDLEDRDIDGDDKLKAFARDTGMADFVDAWEREGHARFTDHYADETGDSVTLVEETRHWTPPAPHERVIDERMTQAGFIEWSTGGGCKAWGKRFDDDGQLMITAGDDDLYAPPDHNGWYIGEHTSEGGPARELFEYLTLDDVLEIARRWELHRWGWES